MTRSRGPQLAKSAGPQRGNPANALLALVGCDIETRRTGSRVELVKAVEALRGKVCVLAQAGRLIIPKQSSSILKLLDRFVKTVDANETFSSWHPKLALVRYRNIQQPDDQQWRLWLGSRNLTRALNWEAGLLLISRADGKGQRLKGVAAAAQTLAAHAKLANFGAKQIAAQLSTLTWECPAGCEVHDVLLFGAGRTTGFPKPPSDTERVLVVSPFLDATTVCSVARWGGPRTRRSLLSTDMQLQRLIHEDAKIFDRYDSVLTQPLPDLPGECVSIRDEEAASSDESAEGEEQPPPGLHAKLFYAASGSRWAAPDSIDTHLSLIW